MSLGEGFEVSEAQANAHQCVVKSGCCATYKTSNTCSFCRTEHFHPLLTTLFPLLSASASSAVFHSVHQRDFTDFRVLFLALSVNILSRPPCSFTLLQMYFLQISEPLELFEEPEKAPHTSGCFFRNPS